MKSWIQVLVLLICVTGSLIACTKSDDVANENLSTEMQALYDAAEGGNATAQIALSNYYFLGNNGAEAKNPQKGIEWLQKAVDQKSAEAQYLMSELYITPEDYGLKANEELAKKLLLASAEQHYSIAQLAVGMRYKLGTHGFPQDLVQAKAWFEKSVEAGNDSAQYQLDHVNE